MAKGKATGKDRQTNEKTVFCGATTELANIARAFPTPREETGTPEWSSDNAACARVNPNNGLLLTFAPGTARITAKYPSGNLYYWDITVTPRPEEAPKSSVSDFGAATSAVEQRNQEKTSTIAEQLQHGKTPSPAEQLQKEKPSGAAEQLQHGKLSTVTEQLQKGTASTIADLLQQEKGVISDLKEGKECTVSQASQKGNLATLLEHVKNQEPLSFSAAIARYKTMRKLVHDGLEMLSELELRPPLPRTVHGRVVLQHFDENDNPQCKPMPGFQVELGGIASPAQDKMENHEDLQCFCGADGCFTLVMPDRYNMQETVTFTVSENPNAPEVLRRKLLLGGTGPRSMTFTRRASELIDAARISVTIEEPVRDAETMTGAKLVTKSFSLPEIFAKLNRFSALERQVNQQAEAWAEEEANRKKRAELKSQLGAAAKARQDALNAVIEALRPAVQNHPALNTALVRCEARLRELTAFLTDFLRVHEASSDSGQIEGLNFHIAENTYVSIPPADQLSLLEQLVEEEDRFLLLDAQSYPPDLPIDPLRMQARQAKRQLVLVAAKLNALPPMRILPHEQASAASTLEQYLSLTVAGYVPQMPAVVNDAKTYVETRDEIEALKTALGMPNATLSELMQYLLNAELNAELGDFLILEEAFAERAAKPAALPSVRLMGEGKNATYLPTDTAPSRMFRYGMIQRLVEPEIRVYDEKSGSFTTVRGRISEPLDVYKFQQGFYADPEKAAIACSLGMGYVLNMHQAWVPDGFALGSLLYSLVLAPGEEQRLVVQEHKEQYTVDDNASATDLIHDAYATSQQDYEEAAFTNAANRYSAAHSDYDYSAKTAAGGMAGIGIFHGLFAGSASSSKNSGGGSSSSSQTDRYDEASQAAQSFQTSIKTEAERLATAQRVSIRTASSSDSQSLASKIIANHNHSHVLTVQYWEVMRRYRMETCIEGIDLVLFVPLKPVGFLPQASDPEHPGGQDDATWAKLLLAPGVADNMQRKYFNYRYGRILQHVDTLLYAVPYRYRSGLELMKKFAACPQWTYLPAADSARRKVLVTLTGNLLECDELTVTLELSTGRPPLVGRVVTRNLIPIHESMNTRKDVLYFIEKARHGKYVIKYSSRMYEQQVFNTPSSNDRLTAATTDRYRELDLKDGSLSLKDQNETRLTFKGQLEVEFSLPAGVCEEDVACVRIENQASHFTYRLSQNTLYMEEYEEVSVRNYEEWLYHSSVDTLNTEFEESQLPHFQKNLPECYLNPQVVITPQELQAAGSLVVEVTARMQGQEKQAALVDEQIVVDRRPTCAAWSRQKLVMHPADVEKMEQALRHIATGTIRYSQAIWSSLTDDERIMLLEPFTVDMNLSADTIFQKSDAASVTVPLLNCVNPQRVLGYYGNCMLLPFIYPASLAKELGKSAGEVQDELFRFHTTGFRVPSTVVSVSTDGMVGEAVLGATNVSEKVDITRFWNWKDSDIDHMNLDQSSFHKGSLLEHAQSAAVTAPVQGPAATAHIQNNGPLKDLLGRDAPKFAEVVSHTDMRELLEKADSNASAGREQAFKANSEMITESIKAAADVAKAFFGGKSSQQPATGGSGTGGTGGSGTGPSNGAGANAGGANGSAEGAPTRSAAPTSDAVPSAEAAPTSGRKPGPKQH